MKAIGGNIGLELQKKTTAVNEIGEKIPTWKQAAALWGYLDKLTGEAHLETFDGKVMDSTHLFICDWVDLGGLKPENCRAVCKGKVFTVLDIDDPMELHHSLEITLRFVGWQDGED